MDELPKALWNRSTVLRAVEHLFPPNQRASAIAQLDRLGSEGWSGLDPYRADDWSRIHLAVLTLSLGDLDKVKRFVDEALTDWRDVLCWAYYYDQSSTDPLIRWGLGDVMPELGREAEQFRSPLLGQKENEGE